LTELKLLDTNIGIIVLSAGVGNDIVGWTLLALSVVLVNAGTGLTAVYILLACIGYALFLLLLGKPILLWLAHQTGSIDNGPTRTPEYRSGGLMAIQTNFALFATPLMPSKPKWKFFEILSEPKGQIFKISHQAS